MFTDISFVKIKQTRKNIDLVSVNSMKIEYGLCHLMIHTLSPSLCLLISFENSFCPSNWIEQSKT